MVANQSRVVYTRSCEKIRLVENGPNLSSEPVVEAFTQTPGRNFCKIISSEILDVSDQI